MPFTQGREKTGGRSKNQPNKISKNIRLASAMLLEGQIEVDTFEHPTEFQIEIVETLKGYSDAELDTAIDKYAENQKKWCQ